MFTAAWAFPAFAAFVTYSLWSVTRYERFGAGAWDLGCRAQSIWLLGHLKGFTSTVLGNVNFMGDHFMPSLVLFAPLSWAQSPELLLVVQALLIAVAAWPLSRLCGRRGLGPLTTAGIVLAYLFGVGTQSAANFDFHEVALLPLSILLAVWAFEEDRRGLAYAALVIAAGCRESAILYAGAVGGWLFVTRPGRRVEGLGIAAVSLAWFLVVVSAIQPRLLVGAPATMMPAARFSALGGTIGEAAVQVLRQPDEAARLLVSPQEKVVTVAVTVGGFGFLPLLAPSALLLSVPNFVERFLADKPEAWGLGYHYSLVPFALLAFATTVAVSRAREWLAWRRVSISPRAFDASIGIILVVSTVGASAAAWPIGVELVTLEKPYFASLEQTAVNQRALDRIPEDGAVVAQNHFLAHLAMREQAWLPDESFLAQADYVVLDPTQSPWPHDAAHVAHLVERLQSDPAFHIIFSEGSTVVFSRRSGG